MLVFFAVGTVAGILLGLRFKLFVLVPAILIATVAVVLSGHGLQIIVLTEVGTVALLQVGYIGGCVLRAMLVHICIRKRLCASNQRDQNWHIEKLDVATWFGFDLR